jgi:hypothetical protein
MSWSHVTLESAPVQSPGPRDNSFGILSGQGVSGLNTVVQNTFQCLYHIIRLELGVGLENQIYTDPEMFNRSISDVYIPGTLPWTYASSNISRSLTSNATLMAEWKETVVAFNTSGSAITSVFASTFAMLSTAWTTFTPHCKRIRPLECARQQQDRCDGRMQLPLACVRLALKKHGILEYVDPEEGSRTRPERERGGERFILFWEFQTRS